MVRRLHDAKAAQPDAGGEIHEHASFADDTPCGLGIVPDGRIVVLTMFRKRLFTFAGGALSLYADLFGCRCRDHRRHDRRWGRARLCRRSRFRPACAAGRGAVGRIILVMSDGAARIVAEGLRFPNGIAVSVEDSRLVVAEMDGECLAEYFIEPDGACASCAGSAA